jgi:hypothetical protein
MLLAEGLNFSARLTNPSDEQQYDAQEAAELGRQALESFLLNPNTNYERVRRRVVWGMLSARMWCAEAYYEEKRIRICSVRPDQIYWDRSCLDPHDPSCRHLFHISRIPLEEAQRKKGWKNAKDLQADSGSGPVARTGDPTLPQGQVRLNDGKSDSAQEEKLVTILKTWIRGDETVRVSNTGRRMLPEDRRYMACASCGYQSQTEGELGFTLPEQGAEPCPDCGGTLERIDTVVTEKTSLEFPKGRLVIIAPFNQHLTEPLYDGKWPYALPTFPYLVARAYDDPDAPAGQSETSLKWDNTFATNFVMRQALEQLRDNRDRMLLPEDGLVGRDGKAFSGTDANGSMMFYNTDFPPQGVTMFRGSGIPSGTMEMYGMLTGNLKSTEGTSDLPIIPGQSLDVPASSLALRAKTGNVPIDDQRESFALDEQQFLNAVYYMLKATMFPARAVPLKDRYGMAKMKKISGYHMPEAEIVITRSQSYDADDARQSAALDAVLAKPPELRKLYARLYRLDPDLLTEAEKAQAEAEAKMKSEAPPQPGGPAPIAAPPGAPSPVDIGRMFSNGQMPAPMQ